MAKPYIPYDGLLVTRQKAISENLKWYFTGKPCKHGHISLRRTSTKACQGCYADFEARKRDIAKVRKYQRTPSDRQLAKDNNLTRYFTGRPCPYGHVSERSVASRACIECQKEFADSVPSHIKAEYARLWLVRHPEEAKEVCRRHNAANRDSRRQQARDAYSADPEKGRARTKAWRERNPEGVRAHAMMRIARKKGNNGKYDAYDIRFLLEAQKSKCPSCKRSLKSGYHVDHIMPLSRGGLNDRTNLQLLCPRCNLTKHAIDPIDWAQRNGRLL